MNVDSQKAKRTRGAIVKRVGGVELSGGRFPLPNVGDPRGRAPLGELRAARRHTQNG
jgi:hypothetical protein